MKKLLTIKHLSLLMLFSLLGGKAQASRMYDDNYTVETRENCESYTCGCNPLYCGAFDVQVQGGVNPIIWRQRDALIFVDCGLAPAATVFNALDNVPKFRKLFRVPWIIGGQIGYAWSDNTRVYVEFNYSQARHKTNEAITLANPVTAFLPAASVLTITSSKYKVFDAYVGARYYWDRWCDRVAFFLGGKVGFTHHKGVNFYGSFTNVTPALVLIPEAAPVALFSTNNVVSGGANFGLDFCFCGNWAFVLTGEIVASSGPRSVQSITPAAAVVTATGINNINVGNVHTELRFPVTAAVRYSF